MRCALEMQAELERLNVERAGAGKPALRMGIGMHSARVVVGDIGAVRRREYTAIGDIVSVAAQIERLTKQYGVALLVSEKTRRRVGGALGFVPAPEAQVPGKSMVVRT